MEGILPGMNNLKFNFQLKELDKIQPFGDDADRSLHWFGLTDGLFWINAGTQTIYEYSEEADAFFDGCGRYNEYYIARFLEDFTHTFRYVGESIPEKLYNDIDKFSEKSEQWRRYHEEEEDAVFDLFFDEEYCAFCEWWWNRGFDSGHLIGGPDIYCFRCGDKIKILWESAFQTGSGKSIWTAPRGCFEMSFEEFISSVTDFLNSFFEAMEKQIEDAVEKEWGSIQLDKQRLILENEERKSDLFNQINLLKNNDEYTNWGRVMALYDKMEQEIAC